MAEIKERFHNLDFLKGLCVLFVIITHFSWKDEQRLYFLFPFWVDMAVPIFMILSGYVHSLSYKKHEINTLSDAYDLKNTINKIIRYTIPFLIIYIVEVTLASIEQGYLDEPLKLFYFFLQGTRGPGSYYYPILLQFVFLFPLIYFIIKRLDFKGLILCAAINFSYEILKNAYHVEEDCYRLIVFRYIFVIAFGCYLAIGKKQIKKACISDLLRHRRCVYYCLSIHRHNSDIYKVLDRHIVSRLYVRLANRGVSYLKKRHQV